MKISIINILYLLIIGCSSSSLIRNKRQLESDYTFPTTPSVDINKDKNYFTEELTTMPTSEYQEFADNQNNSDSSLEDLMLQSFIQDLIENDDSIEELPENSVTFKPIISESFVSSFLSQRDQQQHKHLQQDEKQVEDLSILYNNWSERPNTESNIQKIKQHKRHISEDYMESKDYTRRLLNTYKKSNIQKIKQRKRHITEDCVESKDYTRRILKTIKRYAEHFPEEQSKDNEDDSIKQKDLTNQAWRYALKFPDEFAENEDFQAEQRESIDYTELYADNYSDEFPRIPLLLIQLKNAEQENNREDFDSSVDSGPSHFKLGLELTPLTRNHTKRQSYGLQYGATSIDTDILSPDHLDELEPLPPLDPVDDENGRILSHDHLDNIQNPSFFARAISSMFGFYLSFRRFSSSIYSLFQRLFS